MTHLSAGRTLRTRLSRRPSRPIRSLRAFESPPAARRLTRNADDASPAAGPPQVSYFLWADVPTRRALRRRIALHRTYVSGIERGERNPSLTNLLKLTRALGVDVSDLALRADGLREA